MVSPIYPSGMYPVSGVTPYGQKNDAAAPKVSEQRYDQVQFSSHLDETEKRVKETVGALSREIRTRPTHQELEELRQQVASGTYVAAPREIAARMLLMREDD